MKMRGMKKLKLLAGVMAAVMLLPMFSGCSKTKEVSNVVKADDPWYESVRIKIDRDIKANEEPGMNGTCLSKDYIFDLYCMSPDRGGSSRTVLDIYDFNGKLLSRKGVKCTEDFNIMNIYSLTSDPDGKKINAAVWYHSVSGKNDYKFVDIDTESGEVIDVKDLLTGKAVEALEDNSSLDAIRTVGQYRIMELFVFNSGVLSYQMLLFKGTEFLANLDLSTTQLRVLLEGYSIDEDKGSLYAYGYEKTDIIRMEFDIHSGRLKSKNPVDTSDGNSVNFWEYAMTNSGDMCRIDSLGNIVKIDVNTMTPETVIDTNWYTPYFYPPNSERSMFSSSVLSCDENSAVILDSELVSYACDVSNNAEYFRILRKAEKNPNAGKKIIELALPTSSGITEYLSKAIYEFNNTDDEYLIRIWDKSKSGYATSALDFYFPTESMNQDLNEQQVFQMIQELKGDNAPDLALNIQKNHAMRDEIFMDLSDFLDPEVMDKQYGNIIEAGMIGGKLYFLPVTLEIEGLVTNTDLIKDGAVGITFDDFDKLVKDKMNGFSPYDYPDSKVYNKRSFILSCVDTKRAIEGDKIEFGTDQFRATAQYAKANIKYNNLQDTPEEVLSKWTRYRGECYYTKIDDYLSFVRSCFKTKNQYTIIGTPSVDAAGPRFKALETISVSANTDVKDGCKKFINFLFSGRAFNNAECKFMQIVTNKEIMDKNIESLTKYNNESYAWYDASVKSGVIIPAPDVDKAFGYKYATDEMAESFKKSLASISIYYYEDYSIVQFMDEELAPYYAGDRSLDDAIRYLNDRVTKYVREM